MILNEVSWLESIDEEVIHELKSNLVFDKMNIRTWTYFNTFMSQLSNKNKELLKSIFDEKLESRYQRHFRLKLD